MLAIASTGADSRNRRSSLERIESDAFRAEFLHDLDLEFVIVLSPWTTCKAYKIKTAGT
jgi:hypothetical protein